MLAQVLRSFQVLKVARHVLAGNELLAFRLVTVIAQDYYLVDLEDAGDARDFADEVGANGRGLRDFEDGVGEADGEMGELVVRALLLLDLLLVGHPHPSVLALLVVVDQGETLGQLGLPLLLPDLLALAVVGYLHRQLPLPHQQLIIIDDDHCHSFTMPSHPQLSTVVGWLGCHSSPMQAPA
jgi:hypothetical protein